MGNNNNTPIASCTGRILVVKDGKDGVGITSADVVFAVYVFPDSAPADDFKGWKTLYSDLVFTKDDYLWTATRITNTDGDSWLTGKRCLGSCKDFANVLEMYALGDSKDKAPSEGWSYTMPSPVKGKYLWTKNEMTLQHNNTKFYTTPVCVGYFANDGINGTKFSPKGTANGHYSNYADYKASAQLLPDEMYLVDTVTDKYENTHGAATISYDKLITDNEVILIAAEGDAYNVGGTLWVATSNGWVDFGSIQGAQGESGENAPWVILSKNPIVFESDKKGVVAPTEKLISITVMCGTEIVTSQCTFAFKESSDTHFNKDKASITSSGMETETITINSTGLGTKTIGATDDDAGYQVPYPNSAVILSVTFGNYVFDVIINIVVDTSLVDGYFRTSIKGIEAQYTEINTALTDQGALLTECQSNINVNAEAIKTKVAQTDYDESNKAVDVKFSEVNQRAESIEQSVTAVDKQGKETKSVLEQCVEKQDDGSYMSKMRMYADNITLSAGHILNIQGDYLVVNTTNFKIDENGNVTLSGKVNAKSGSIGGFTITESNLHSSADGYSFDIYNDRLVYVDQKNSRTLSIMSDDTNGLRLSMGAAENNSMCNIQVTERGIGLVSTNGDGFKSEYSEGAMYVSRGDAAISFWIARNSFGNAFRFPTTKAGLRGLIDITNTKLRLLAVGLPTSPVGLAVGEIYNDNGVLKIVQ